MNMLLENKEMESGCVETVLLTLHNYIWGQQIV